MRVVLVLHLGVVISEHLLLVELVSSTRLRRIHAKERVRCKSTEAEM